MQWLDGPCEACYHQREILGLPHGPCECAQGAGRARWFDEPDYSDDDEPEIEPAGAAWGPIETAYNGYRFRSRHEARFAVLLDELGVRYGYEVEGFHLGGRDYLPDFRVRGRQRYWVEVKYERPDGDDLAEAAEKAWRLAWHTGEDVFLVYGEFRPPLDRDGLAAMKWSATGFCGDDYVLTECMSCEEIGFGWWGLEPPEGCWCPPLRRPLAIASRRLVSAYLATRSARFEFGETPSHS